MYIVARLLLAAMAILTTSCITIPYKLVESSPSRTYEVRLGEEIEPAASGDPWPYKVFLSISKHGRSVIDRELVYPNILGYQKIYYGSAANTHCRSRAVM